MSTLNDIVQRVRSHPFIAGSKLDSMAEDNFAFTVSQLLFPVLTELGEKYGVQALTKHYLLTDPATVTVALDGAGVADLSALITGGLLIGAHRQAKIYHESNQFPLIETTAGRLPRNTDAMFLHYWIEGKKLFTRSVDNNATPLAGTLALAWAKIPDLTILASLPQLIDEAVEMLVERLRGVAEPEEAEV